MKTVVSSALMLSVPASSRSCSSQTSCFYTPDYSLSWNLWASDLRHHHPTRTITVGHLLVKLKSTSHVFVRMMHNSFIELAWLSVRSIVLYLNNKISFLWRFMFFISVLIISCASFNQTLLSTFRSIFYCFCMHK